MSLILSTRETLGASGTAGIPGEYVSYAISPNPAPIIVTGSSGSVTATYVVDPTIFPLQYIEYVGAAGSVVRVSGIDAWDNLPGPVVAQHIVKMREDTKDLIEYTLTVTSKETIPSEEEGGEATEVFYQTVFTIIIFADYDVSKDLLTAAVNDRR
jgi:hypothetical protein